MIISILLPAGVAFLIAFLCMPLIRIIAFKLGLTDNPEKHAHPAVLHKKILPRAGGLAIYLGIVTSIILFIPLEKHLIGLLIGATVIVIDGLLDDKYDLKPAYRLIFQIIAAAIVVGFGVGITYITNPFGGIIRLDTITIPVQFFGAHNILLLADFFAFLWIIWTINLVNWSSGVDGQMPGFIIIAAATLALLSLPFTAYDPAQWNIIKIAGITIGATLAFLLFNWHPAKILPGDSGSMLLGFLLAFLAIYSGGKVATAVVVLAIPTLDAAWAIIRRIKRGQNPMRGDREHLHHRLLELGLSQRTIAVTYWTLAAVCGGIALLFQGRGKFWFLIITAGFLAFFLIAINRLQKRKPSQTTQ